VSCAFFDGDYTLTLEAAQRRKHDLVFTQLGLAAGDSLLDIGCGWGPLLAAARECGVRGIGLTLSPAQVARCRGAGLEARLLDWRDQPSDGGQSFDGLASLGAFEHFASPTDRLQGRQETVYRDFFRKCWELLPEGGRLFLQTMTWGRRVPDPGELDVHAPRLSDRWVLGHLAYLYPGSWVPDGLDQIERCAAPWFEPTFVSNGAQDYVHTMYRWGNAVDRLGVRKWLLVTPMLARATIDPSARRWILALRHACARECFERGLFSHFRIVLAKRTG
jgi:cyclopropane-fatty-acyl-phospholipid synthase